MIFIIDDDQSMRRAFSLLLRTVGFVTREFSSAEEFFNYSRISECDCIILDIRMPEMNGFELMEKLLSTGVHVPVICVTAFDDAESRERALELGATAYFTKPVDDQALIDAIKWAIQGRKKMKI
jgi:two-component system, LuxR family, response regulator FixJ